MSRKKLKFKRRHKISLSESMTSENRVRDNLRFDICRIFPDPIKRMRYMRGLLRGLDKEILK